MFLILDPHYTGGEDLATIQGKACMMEGYRATACGLAQCQRVQRPHILQLLPPAEADGDLMLVAIFLPNKFSYFPIVLSRERAGVGYGRFIRRSGSV